MLDFFWLAVLWVLWLEYVVFKGAVLAPVVMLTLFSCVSLMLV